MKEFDKYSVWFVLTKKIIVNIIEMMYLLKN